MSREGMIKYLVRETHHTKESLNGCSDETVKKYYDKEMGIMGF